MLGAGSGSDGRWQIADCRGIRPSAICCLLSAFHSVDQSSSFEVRDRQEIAFDRHRCVGVQDLEEEAS